jgi:Rho termination factor, N-terminal domain.
MKLDELKQLAVTMGISGTSKMRKSDILTAIRERGGESKSATDGAQSAKSAPRRSRRATSAPATPVEGERTATAPAAAKTDNGGDQNTGDNTTGAQPAEAKADRPAEARADQNNHKSVDLGDRADAGNDRDGDKAQRQGGNDRDDRQSGNDRGNRNRNDGDRGNRNDGDRQGGNNRQGNDGGNRNNDRSGDRNDGDRGNRNNDGNRQDGNRQDGNRQDGNRQSGNNRQGGNRQGANNDRNNDRWNDDDGNGRGRRRQRGRDRKRGRGRADDFGDVDTQVREDDVLVPVAGIVDVMDNYAFVRTSGYLSGRTTSTCRWAWSRRTECARVTRSPARFVRCATVSSCRPVRSSTRSFGWTPSTV